VLANNINKRKLTLLLRHKELWFSVTMRAKFLWECPIRNWKRLGKCWRTWKITFKTIQIALKKCILQVWRRPQYHISRLKLLKYSKKYCSIWQYCKSQCNLICLCQVQHVSHNAIPLFLPSRTSKLIPYGTIWLLQFLLLISNIFYLLLTFIVVGQLLQTYSSSEVCYTYCEEQEGLDGLCPDW